MTSFEDYVSFANIAFSHITSEVKLITIEEAMNLL